VKLAWLRAIAALVVTFHGVSLMSSCSVLTPPQVETRKALLSKTPADLPRSTPQAAVLLVFPPQAQPVYDTMRMAYMVRPYQVDYFSQHEWGETPSQMLHPLLIRTLQETNRFKAVLAPPFSGRYAYALRTQVVELVQDFTVDPPTLRLSLRLQLSDDAANRVVATKEIALREPMREKGPYAGVVAANDAAAKALREAAVFVLEEVR
jgi:cholesterol transport system auxiliary component